MKIKEVVGPADCYQKRQKKGQITTSGSDDDFSTEKRRKMFLTILRLGGQLFVPFFNALSRDKRMIGE
jgi:hypothetical protein